MKAYADCLSATSTKWAPWYVIPADHKWVARAVVADVITTSLRALGLKYPEVTDAHGRSWTRRNGGSWPSRHRAAAPGRAITRVRRPDPWGGDLRGLENFTTKYLRASFALPMTRRVEFGGEPEEPGAGMSKSSSAVRQPVADTVAPERRSHRP